MENKELKPLLQSSNRKAVSFQVDLPSHVARPTRNRLKEYDASETWDFSLGRSKKAHRKVTEVEDVEFQRLLNFRNVFGTCKHLEIKKRPCSCPKQKLLKYCRDCYTTFPESEDDDSISVSDTNLESESVPVYNDVVRTDQLYARRYEILKSSENKSIPATQTQLVPGPGDEAGNQQPTTVVLAESSQTVLRCPFPCDVPVTLPLMEKFKVLVSFGVTLNDFYVVRKESVIERVRLGDGLLRNATFGLKKYRHGREISNVVVIYHAQYRWVRAKVLKMTGSNECAVRLIDYGDEVIVNLNDLLVPTKYARQIPAFAYHCSMHLEPTEISKPSKEQRLNGEEWNSELMATLTKMGNSNGENTAAGADGITVCCNKVMDSTSLVDVEIIGQDVTWNNMLVHLGLATFKQE